MRPQPGEDMGAYLERLVAQGQVKLEITGGVPTWRLLPSPRHQKVIDRIRASIRPIPGAASCGCHHLADVQLKFPDGSFKRPDIAIFCVEPPDLDESWEMVPEAVVEVISLDYAEKDLETNPPWYLAQGVKDVLVLDPRSGAVAHHHHGRAVVQAMSPYTADLLCGCRVIV